MTCTPMEDLAIHLDSISEMNDPLMPMTAEESSRLLRLMDTPFCCK